MDSRSLVVAHFTPRQGNEDVHERPAVSDPLWIPNGTVANGPLPHEFLVFDMRLLSPEGCMSYASLPILSAVPPSDYPGSRSGQASVGLDLSDLEPRRLDQLLAQME